MTDRAAVEAWVEKWALLPSSGGGDLHDLVETILAFAAAQRAEEREACAQLSQRKAATRCSAHQLTGKGVCGSEIADEIRARREGRGE